MQYFIDTDGKYRFGDEGPNTGAGRCKYSKTAASWIDIDISALKSDTPN